MKHGLKFCPFHNIILIQSLPRGVQNLGGLHVCTERPKPQSDIKHGIWSRTLNHHHHCCGCVSLTLMKSYVCEFIYLGYEGNGWTYEKRVAGRVLCWVRLDMAVANSPWSAPLPASHTSALDGSHIQSYPDFPSVGGNRLENVERTMTKSLGMKSCGRNTSNLIIFLLMHGKWKERYLPCNNWRRS
jgi:hypothetical protein